MSNEECITEGCEEPNKGKWSGGYCGECMVFVAMNMRQPNRRDLIAMGKGE